MSNCNVCGRATKIVQKKTISSGKYKGWIQVKHRCELHGTFDLKIRPARKGN